MQVRCLKCKGRGFCGKISCPIINTSSIRFNIRDAIKNIDSSFESQSPAPFVGRVGYPNINVGILAPSEKKEDIDNYDSPKNWANEKKDINSIVNLRSSLINSRMNVGVLEKNKFIDIAKEVAMAKTSPDLELNLKKRPVFSLNIDPINTPMGPNADIINANLTVNPKIDNAVEKAVSDTDLLSLDAIKELYKKGIDENKISKLLSVGTLGVGNKRKLVPTRWSITAVDDNLGKEILNQIKDYKQTNYLSFFSGYLGNYYLVLMFPDVWSYELFEVYLPKVSWNQSEEINFSTDYESYEGRKTYAENCAGGYYAARIAVLEKLKEIKRQASVIMIRIITGEYTTPLGVWVCRESSRKSLNERPIEFASKELMMIYVRNLIKKRFGLDIDIMLNQSRLLNNMKVQSKLNQYF
jgi:DNA repair protein NreA